MVLYSCKHWLSRNLHQTCKLAILAETWSDSPVSLQFGFDLLHLHGLLHGSKKLAAETSLINELHR